MQRTAITTFRILVLSSALIVPLVSGCGDSPVPAAAGGSDAAADLAATDLPLHADTPLPFLGDVAPAETAETAPPPRDGAADVPGPTQDGAADRPPLDAGCHCPPPTVSTIRVCGSDGQNHASACLAACAGVAVVDGCACGRRDGAVCGCHHGGDLVCGSDGQTWTNACLASQVGVRVASTGACGTGAQSGTLPQGADCQKAHDLCGPGLKCCDSSTGVDAGNVVFRCRATMAPDTCPLSP